MAKTATTLIKAHMVLTITIWSLSPALVFEAADLLKSGSSFFCTKLGLQKQVTEIKCQPRMMRENQSLTYHMIDWNLIFWVKSLASLFVTTIPFPNNHQFLGKVKIWLINRFRNPSLVCWSGIGIAWCLQQEQNQNYDLCKALELDSHASGIK